MKNRGKDTSPQPYNHTVDIEICSHSSVDNFTSSKCSDLERTVNDFIENIVGVLGEYKKQMGE